MVDPEDQCDVVVLGDLSVDMVTSIRAEDTVRPLVEGKDATVWAENRLLVGGTAYLFATAARALADAECMIMSSVGKDLASGVVRERMAAEGMTTDGIHASDTATGVYSTTYLDDGQRLMVCPENHASRDYPLSIAQRALGAIGDRPPAAVWVSGYVLGDREYPTRRLRAVRHVCDWARARNVAVVLDLVPHAFAARVGSLHLVEDLIGPVDVLVAEFGTACDLAGHDPAVTTSASVEQVARALAQSARTAAIVQFRAGQDLYRQAVVESGASSSEPVIWHQRRIAPEGLRGMGDRLAIDGLIALEVLTTRRTRTA